MDGSDATPHYHLYRRSRTPVWLALSWRALLAFALIGIALAVHWFDRDGLRQSSGAPVTFADILELALSGLHLCDIDVEETNRITLEALPLRLVALDIR